MESRAEAWCGIGYSDDTAHTLASWEQRRGVEFRTDAEARVELGNHRDAMHRGGRALWEERREHGRLEGYGQRCREASNVTVESSAWRRAFSRDAREEYDRAKRDLEYYGRELGRAGVDGPGELARRGEDLSRREGAQQAREEAWGPCEKAWREIGDAMEARREAER